MGGRSGASSDNDALGNIQLDISEFRTASTQGPEIEFQKLARKSDSD